MGTAVAPVVPFHLYKRCRGDYLKTKKYEKIISYDWLTKPRENGKFVKKKQLRLRQRQHNIKQFKAIER